MLIDHSNYYKVYYSNGKDWVEARTGRVDLDALGVPFTKHTLLSDALFLAKYYNGKYIKAPWGSIIWEAPSLRSTAYPIGPGYNNRALVVLRPYSAQWRINNKWCEFSVHAAYSSALADVIHHSNISVIDFRICMDGLEIYYKMQPRPHKRTVADFKREKRQAACSIHNNPKITVSRKDLAINMVNGDMKESLGSARKPDITHLRKSTAVYIARTCEYGNDKYQRANFIRPTGGVEHITPTKEDFERFRNYLRAYLSHGMEVLDSMERHQSIDPNLTDVEGMKRACYAADTDATPGAAVGASLLPHICGGMASGMMAIEQAIQCGLLPADPATPWRK